MLKFKQFLEEANIKSTDYPWPVKTNKDPATKFWSNQSKEARVRTCCTNISI